ncbi:MAG TPA: hypothetical protein VFP50_10735 [Anaeromyxobacteraceae bacterium]|nr:hypothetical protein [Anaeromyxobacteraceae bacterium]
MWNPTTPTRHALALLAAAGVAFLGSAMMMKAGRVFPALAGGGLEPSAPGPLLAPVVVVLLAVVGGLLVAMAASELMANRRRRRRR